MALKVVSKRFSFQGWKWAKWLKGHWKTVKETTKVFLPQYLGWLAGLSPEWQVLVTALGAGALSAIEYFVKEYKA